MNKLITMGILLIAFIGIGVAGGIFEQLPSNNLTIEVDANRMPILTRGYTIADINDIKYSYKCNATECEIILNKKDLFSNKIISVANEQTCLEWSEPVCTMLPYTQTMDCKPKTRTCLKSTNYTLEQIISNAILKEIEFVSDIKYQRNARTTAVADSEGSILIQQRR